MTSKELLERKRRALLKGNEVDYLLSAVIDPKRVSPDGKFIELGGYYSDQVRGWYPIDGVAMSVKSVLKEFSTEEEIEQEHERASFWQKVWGNLKMIDLCIRPQP